ncbi:MAG TPA: DUF1444 family protein [Methylomirabilota bacterium]|nr:DUF1444 family protein [Methylomirabilota bacterium]
MLKPLLNRLRRTQSPEEFTEEVASLVKAKGASAEKTSEPFELKVEMPDKTSMTLNLSNAYALYLRDKTERNALIEQYVTGMLEVDREKVLLRDIVPIIKDKDFLKEMAPNFRGPIDETFVFEPYNSELDIVYAMDNPTSIGYLTPEKLKELNLQGEKLRDVAISNLKRVLPPAQVIGGPPLFAISAGGMFESSLLLLDRVWNKQNLGVAGEILVAIPSRETLLVADSAAPSAAEKLKKAATDLSLGAPYRLTSALFVRRGDTFTCFET